MLNITNKDNYNINDKNSVLSVGMSNGKNSKTQDKNSLLIDETLISSDALKLYEREQDIQKFTALALSDFDSIDKDNERVLNKLFSIVSSMREEEFANSLLNNEEFKSDLLGQ